MGNDVSNQPKMLQEISLLAHATINSVAVVSDNSRQPLGEIQTPNTFFKGRVNKMAKTIVLQLSGMDDTDARKLVEDKLIGLPGVVSFTFDMKLGRVIVRARDWIKAEVCFCLMRVALQYNVIQSLCQTIASTATVSARQVVKSEAGEEIMLSFGSSPTKFDNGSTKVRLQLVRFQLMLPDADRSSSVPRRRRRT